MPYHLTAQDQKLATETNAASAAVAPEELEGQGTFGVSRFFGDQDQKTLIDGAWAHGARFGIDKGRHISSGQ
jgi:hypothetical protein